MISNTSLLLGSGAYCQIGVRQCAAAAASMTRRRASEAAMDMRAARRHGTPLRRRTRAAALLASMAALGRVPWILPRRDAERAPVPEDHRLPGSSLLSGEPDRSTAAEPRCVASSTPPGVSVGYGSGRTRAVAARGTPHPRDCFTRTAQAGTEAVAAIWESGGLFITPSPDRLTCDDGQRQAMNE